MFASFTRDFYWRCLHGIFLWTWRFYNVHQSLLGKSISSTRSYCRWVDRSQIASVSNGHPNTFNLIDYVLSKFRHSWNHLQAEILMQSCMKGRTGTACNPFYWNLILVLKQTVLPLDVKKLLDQIVSTIYSVDSVDLN